MSLSFVLLETVLEGTFINLHVLREVCSADGINVVGVHIITIDRSTIDWVDISFSVCMECWFSEIGSKGRIR